MIRTILLMLLLSAAGYFIITTAVNCLLMGALRFRFSAKCREPAFLIMKSNCIDQQTGYQCSAFSSAYVLRHWGIEESGARLYERMPCKMKDGYVYPKGILKLLHQYGLKVKYHSGNLAALKNAVSTGNPVIVLIRVRPDKDWLHFVPVVGYDEQNIFVAESLAELVNCNEPHYNRSIPTHQFRKLWNTSMLKMPLYRNTYLFIE